MTLNHCEVIVNDSALEHTGRLRLYYKQIIIIIIINNNNNNNGLGLRPAGV